MRNLAMMVMTAWIGIGVVELPLEAQAPVAGDVWVQTAESFVRKLESGDWAGAAGMVGPQMRQAGVTPTMLEQTWQQLTAAGALKELRFDTGLESGGYRVVDFIATFGATSLRFRVSLDAEKRVEGFRLFPVTAATPYVAPSYVDASKFEEVELEVGAEGWPLGATLTLPKGVARAPVVVLVHGSGAHDRDETLGPSKPFVDLAHGLASSGVAVLRYEKRNWKHAARMAADLPGLTVEQEVVADALAALAQVRKQPRIDAAKVFVAGHSLGGMLAPEIAARDGSLAGVILLAGSPRRLQQLVLEQVAYLRTLPANAAPEAQKQMDELRTAMEKLERNEYPPAEIVMGAPASYYYDLAKRAPLPFLAQVKAPVLVLQGGRDYQVTKTDYDLYREALAGRPDARFAFYPDLSHLFAPGTGTSTPAEYMQPGHVDGRVIADIVAFVNAR
jgi:dienelactone hydrolase